MRYSLLLVCLVSLLLSDAKIYAAPARATWLTEQPFIIAACKDKICEKGFVVFSELDPRGYPLPQVLKIEDFGGNLNAKLSIIFSGMGRDMPGDGIYKISHFRCQENSKTICFFKDEHPLILTDKFYHNSNVPSKPYLGVEKISSETSEYGLSRAKESLLSERKNREDYVLQNIRESHERAVESLIGIHIDYKVLEMFDNLFFINLGISFLLLLIWRYKRSMMLKEVTYDPTTYQDVFKNYFIISLVTLFLFFVTYAFYFLVSMSIGYPM